VDGEAHAVEAESSPHDLRLPVELTLEGAEHRIEIEWTGGLSVVPPRIGLEPGQTSSGLRIVNFDREDGAWRLSVEGEGGRSYRVRLIGQPVTIQKTVFSSEGADRTSAGARVAYQQDDVTDLELRLPAEETMRRLMTVYLEGAR
jgi:hypothetical protein